MTSNENEDQGLLGSGAFWFGAFLFFILKIKGGL